MNPSILGVFCLLVCVHSRSLLNERLNALDLSENRDLFLSALQAYFSRRGIHVDRTAPSYFILSSKSRSNRDSFLDGDRLLETQSQENFY
ncbi:hypothetical protein GDO78_004511 [Eleutherodactylus coqui]|uniref:Uncharacterized protein n=1 Tax=Eleutherodactylus coqui TaxID=57060 RepID=A0A8J6ERI4_ELECQ|nr:hypothetical protein GDO78_004511 [Eleutherodactylus coqui]